MPNEVTTNIQLLANGEMMPVQIWLNEGHVDKIQQDLDAVSFEEVAQLELNEDLDEEFEA